MTDFDCCSLIPGTSHCHSSSLTIHFNIIFQATGNGSYGMTTPILLLRGSVSLLSFICFLTTVFKYYHISIKIVILYFKSLLFYISTSIQRCHFNLKLLIFDNYFRNTINEQVYSYAFICLLFHLE